MKIDFHTHICSPEVIAHREEYQSRDRWFGALYADPRSRLVTADDVVAAMDQAGVDAAVVFGFAWADQGLCRADNDYTLDAMRRWPGRLIGLAVVNPVAQGAEAELERCLQHGMVGAGELMPEGQGYELEDPRLGNLLEQMVAWNSLTLIHAGEPVGHVYPGKCAGTLESFYRLALQHPSARLIAAHWGGGLLFYELMPEVRKALEHVYYDTAASPFLYDPQIWSLAAQIVPHKVLFGTDYPLISHQRYMDDLDRAGLDPEYRAMILGENAERVLRVRNKAS